MYDNQDLKPIFVALGRLPEGYAAKATFSVPADGTPDGRITLLVMKGAETKGRCQWVLPGGNDSEATILRVAGLIQAEGGAELLARLERELPPPPAVVAVVVPALPPSPPGPPLSDGELAMLPDMLFDGLQRATSKKKKLSPDEFRQQEVLRELGIDPDDDKPKDKTEWDTFVLGLDITQVSSYCDCKLDGLPAGRVTKVYMTDGTAWLVLTPIKKFAVKRAAALMYLSTPIEPADEAEPTQPENGL